MIFLPTNKTPTSTMSLLLMLLVGVFSATLVESSPFLPTPSRHHYYHRHHRQVVPILRGGGGPFGKTNTPPAAALFDGLAAGVSEKVRTRMV
jgi:hypothetical protein